QWADHPQHYPLARWPAPVVRHPGHHPRCGHRRGHAGDLPVAGTSPLPGPPQRKNLHLPNLELRLLGFGRFLECRFPPLAARSPDLLGGGLYRDHRVPIPRGRHPSVAGVRPHHPRSPCLVTSSPASPSSAAPTSASPPFSTVSPVVASPLCTTNRASPGTASPPPCAGPGFPTNSATRGASGRSWTTALPSRCAPRPTSPSPRRTSFFSSPTPAKGSIPSIRKSPRTFAPAGRRSCCW